MLNVLYIVSAFSEEKMHSTGKCVEMTLDTRPNGHSYPYQVDESIPLSGFWVLQITFIRISKEHSVTLIRCHIKPDLDLHCLSVPHTIRTLGLVS